MTQEHQDYLKDISEIKDIMSRSSRFISLSGLAGVFAGFWALCGAAYAYYLLMNLGYSVNVRHSLVNKTLFLLFIDAIVVLILAIASGIFFTTRKAKQEGESIWDKKILTLVWNLAVPLVTGGLFCLVLLWYKLFVFVAPATLIFYGISLFSAGNYTHNDVKQLGLFQIVLGLANCFFLGKGLYFWAFGFGVMHIVYGIIMYYKYERNA